MQRHDICAGIQLKKQQWDLTMCFPISMFFMFFIFYYQHRDHIPPDSRQRVVYDPFEKKASWNARVLGINPSELEPQDFERLTSELQAQLSGHPDARAQLLIGRDSLLLSVSIYQPPLPPAPPPPPPSTVSKLLERISSALADPSDVDTKPPQAPSAAAPSPTHGAAGISENDGWDLARIARILVGRETAVKDNPQLARGMAAAALPSDRTQTIHLQPGSRYALCNWLVQISVSLSLRVASLNSLGTRTNDFHCFYRNRTAVVSCRGGLEGRKPDPESCLEIFIPNTARSAPFDVSSEIDVVSFVAYVVAYSIMNCKYSRLFYRFPWYPSQNPNPSLLSLSLSISLLVPSPAPCSTDIATRRSATAGSRKAGSSSCGSASPRR